MSFSTLTSSNLSAAAGCDGIPGLFLKACWTSLGKAFLDVITKLFISEQPTKSTRTPLMVYNSKSKKPNSFKPSDKRQILILNTDFKVYEGLIARRFRKLGDNTLSDHQYVAGKSHNIHHGIYGARDDIYITNSKGLRCGIGNQDYVATFDFLVLDWIRLVLERKCVKVERKT